MYKCEYCGWSGDYPDEKRYCEDRGYYGSERVYQEITEMCCPHCGHEVNEVEPKCCDDDCEFYDWTRHLCIKHRQAVRPIQSDCLDKKWVEAS